MPDAPRFFRPPHQRSRAEVRRQVDAKRDAERQSRQWYRSYRWRKRSEEQRRKEPTCRLCREQGIVTLATLADHIEPHRDDYDAFWYGEIQSLCTNCHSSVKQREEAVMAQGGGG